MTDKFILVDREPVPADLETWAAWFERIENRRVARTVVGDAVVSTVCLGLDHRFNGEGPPVLFETQVFVAGSEISGARCCTWAQAEAQHARFVAELVEEGA